MAKTIFKGEECLIFDGAMGTMLQQAGLKAGELPELYNILHPDLVRDIHRAYLQAGAQVICTNTFQANEEKLAGSGQQVKAVIQRAIALARQAGAELVALSMGPLPSMMRPLGDTSFAEVYQQYRQQVLAAREDADLILIETQSDLHQAKAAILAAKENSSLPVFCTLTFQEDGRTFLGTDPVTAVHALQGLGVDCLGANCSLGPAELKPLLAKMAPHTQVPLLVQANAGLPQVVAGETTFPVGPEEFAASARDFARLGVAAIGGCCGTTPAHIKAMKKALSGIKPQKTVALTATSACSSTALVVLGNGTIIGERLNPTGNKELKDALQVGDPGPWLSLAIAQAEAGAQLLDVNVGLPGIDEELVLPQLVEQIQGVVDTPLVLDSANPSALAAAARVYNGKPIINSVNGKTESLAQVLPLVKKYGAAVIGLTIDQQGIPARAGQRLAIANRILAEALALGIPRQDLIVDCLTLTAAAQPEQIPETLKAIGLVKEKLGLTTILGISNVSHGLPRRGLLNSTFLTQALTCGLDSAIVDPLDPEVGQGMAAWRVLTGEDVRAQAYIATAMGEVDDTPLQENEPLSASIAAGNQKAVAEAVTLLLAKLSPKEIIEKSLVPPLTEVGLKYDQGKIFLPQLLRSAEAVQAGLAVLRKTGASLGPARGEIILATVQGDIHDIGKNIVKLLLENQGFRIIDLGKDVPVEAIVATAEKLGAKLVGLSALMTTTVDSMARTIKTLNQALPQCAVMVGGAVLTPQYAQEIGADFYAPDALAGVKIATKVFADQT